MAQMLIIKPSMKDLHCEHAQTPLDSLTSCAIEMPFFQRIASLFTLFLTVTTFASCSVVDEFYGESCKTHAYLHQNVGDYVISQISGDSPARLAIIPFTVPANFSPRFAEVEGLGFELARKMHGQFLGYEWIPIVEVLGRSDWPGKREEFFTGNHGAISHAREAGFQLILVGYLEAAHSLTTATLYTKLIDVQSGITISYIRAEGSSSRRNLKRSGKSLRTEVYHPAEFELAPMYDEIVECTVEAIRREEGYDEEGEPISSFIDTVLEFFEGE